MSSPPDPSRIPDHLWEYEGESLDGLRRHYLCRVDGYVFRKTENLVEDQLLAENRASLNESYGNKFRDDAIGTKGVKEIKSWEIGNLVINRLRKIDKLSYLLFASVYRDFASRLRDGDTDFVKHWLNHDENRPYRTFRGKV